MPTNSASKQHAALRIANARQRKPSEHPANVRTTKKTHLAQVMEGWHSLPSPLQTVLLLALCFAVGATASAMRGAKHVAPNPHVAAAETVEPQLEGLTHEGPSEVPSVVAPRSNGRTNTSRELLFRSDNAVSSNLQNGMVITGATAHRLLLFTFDDGPDPRNTPRLLDILEERSVRAVFFLTASRFAGNTPWERQVRDVAQQIVARGHFVGSHSMDHLQFPLLHGESLDAQVIPVEEIFARTFGARPWLIRPPGGARSARIDRYLGERGYTQMLWNLGSGDTQVDSAEDVLKTWVRVLRRKERENGEHGGIILLHDIHASSVDAVPLLLQWIDAQNCELLRRNEELYDIVDDPSVFFIPRGDASASQAAPLAEPPAGWIARRQERLRESYSERCPR